MANRAGFSEEFGTRFSVSIDTEEEFEWDAAFSRERHGTTAVAALREGQAFFASAGVAPIYYVDTPVIEDDAAADLFADIAHRGEADIGVHLHPWVTPPFVEMVNSRNSYAGNLPEEVERAKLRHTRDAVIRRVGIRPIAYRAGRYGIGPNSHRILVEEGFRCDSSVRTLFDYRADGGPDFSREGHHPAWTGPGGSLLELPVTSVFTGRIGRAGRWLYPALARFPLARAALARGGLMERVPLTPEGVPADKACEAIDVALDIGVPLLTLSFHSPSLAVGHTPYVRDGDDLRALYGWFDRVFDHFARRGVAPATLDEILRGVLRPPEQGRH